MKPLIIYHANCADGFGAAFAAWTILGDEAEYLPMAYGQKQPTIQLSDGGKNREVYILDFSFDQIMMDFLFTNAERVVWLDHHATAFKEHGFPINQPGESAITPLSKHDIILDNNRSGALIAWEYFHPNEEVPMLIQHIDDYDRWQFELEGTKAFNKALWSYAPWSFEQWDVYRYLDEGPGGAHQHFIREGKAILRAHDQNVQSVVKSATRTCAIITPQDNQDRYIGLAANCPPHLASDIGHELANQSGTYGLLWAQDKDGKIKCSLRSNGDYDVSAIAKALGGGGHKNAAGFETDLNILQEWLK